MRGPGLIITGASGSGKSTLCRELKHHGWQYVPQFTTRPRRPGEDVNEYHFVKDTGFWETLKETGFAHQSYQVGEETWEYFIPNYFLRAENAVANVGIDAASTLVGDDRFQVIGLNVDSSERMRRLKLAGRFDPRRWMDEIELLHHNRVEVWMTYDELFKWAIAEIKRRKPAL